MFVVVVDFILKSETAEAACALIAENARLSVSLEAGCKRFDVYRNLQDPFRILLYEIYDSREAFDVHLGSMHYKSFQAGIADHLVSKDVTYLSAFRPHEGSA